MIWGIGSLLACSGARPWGGSRASPAGCGGGTGSPDRCCIEVSAMPAASTLAVAAAGWMSEGTLTGLPLTAEMSAGSTATVLSPFHLEPVPLFRPSLLGSAATFTGRFP